MLSDMKDDTIMTLLRVCKKRGAYPFFRDPRNVVKLREVAASRGIFGSKSEEDAIAAKVMRAMGSKQPAVRVSG